MDYKKVSAAFIVFTFFFYLFSFSQEYITRKFLSQDYIKYKDLKNKLSIFSQNLSFKQIYAMYLDFYTRSQLVIKSQTSYVSIMPYIRRAVLKIFNTNAKKYKNDIEQKVDEYLKKDNFTDMIKLLYVVPINAVYSRIWTKVMVAFLEDGDCYKIKYVFDKFKIKTMLPKLFSLGAFCFKKNVIRYNDSYSFNLTEYALKGDMDFFEEPNVMGSQRNFFANYGFIKYRNNLLFYNGNVLYKLSFEKEKVSIDKILDGLGRLSDVYSYDYGSSKKEYLMTFREVFDLVLNRNNLYICQLFEKEAGISKVVTRDNMLFGGIVYTIPMKYPRFFRNFVIYNVDNQKIEYFFSGNKRDNSFEKFSCQNIVRLDSKSLLVSGVFGERYDTFAHSILKFDVSNRRILWETFITSGFMERNLFGNPAYESWGSPLECDSTSCIFTIDLGAVVSIDHVMGNINWLLSLPVYKLKATVSPYHFDKLPYFTENKPPLINGKDIFIQIVSNPNIYKISVSNNTVSTFVFEGSKLSEGNVEEDTTLGFDNFYYIDAPRFFYKYGTNLFLIYDLYIKVKDIYTGKEIYKQSFLSNLNGKPMLFMNMLFIPFSEEIIILSLDSFKILYQVNIKHNKKFISSYYSNGKLYILFKDGLWVLRIKSKRKGESS